MVFVLVKSADQLGGLTSSVVVYVMANCDNCLHHDTPKKAKVQGAIECLEAQISRISSSESLITSRSPSQDSVTGMERLEWISLAVNSLLRCHSQYPGRTRYAELWHSTF
jgi:hypothetical protein